MAALSTIEKAFAKPLSEGEALKASIAVLALVLVDLLKTAFFLSALNFFIADLIIGMA